MYIATSLLCRHDNTHTPLDVHCYQSAVSSWQHSYFTPLDVHCYQSAVLSWQHSYFMPLDVHSTQLTTFESKHPWFWHTQLQKPISEIERMWGADHWYLYKGATQSNLILFSHIFEYGKGSMLHNIFLGAYTIIIVLSKLSKLYFITISCF